MKIAITGNPGSGKSTLAQQLGELLNLPVYHLDYYFWKPGWQEPDRADFERIHNELCDRDTWIIEGVATRFLDYRATQADIVIFLDIPTYLCLYRVLKRAYIHFGKEHFASPKGCPERGPDWKFIQFILTFWYRRRPTIIEIIERYRIIKKIFVVKNSQEVEQLMEWFKNEKFNKG